MFSSSAKSTSKSAKFDKDGLQLNGLILGQRDAVYMATFVSALSKEYREEIQKRLNKSENSSISEDESPKTDSELPAIPAFDREVFNLVLQRKLKEYKEDDQNRFGGRLIEYRDVFTGIDDEGEVASGIDWYSPFDPKDEYIRNWRKFFAQEEPDQFEQKSFEVVKNLLLNTKSVFESERRYQILENAMDVLIKFMRDNYILQNKATPRDSGALIKLHRASDALDRISTFEEAIGQNTEVAFKPTKNQVPEVLKKLGFDYTIDLSKNEFLSEYFLSMKKYLASLFLCSIVDHQGIFVRREDAMGSGLRSVCGLVPLFGDLVKIAGIAVVTVKDMALRKKLNRITDLALNYSDLPDKISRLMAILRANTIIGVSDITVKLKKNGIISEALINLGLKNNLTEAEMLAFNDAKIIEGTILVLIETKQINVVNFPDIAELQQKIIEVLMTTGTINMSNPRKDSSLDEASINGKRLTEVTIDEKMIKANEYLPKNLIRKKDEKYEAYYLRVNNYLKGLPLPHLRDMLVKIDPLEPKYRPTITLVLKRIEKKEKCSLI